MPLANSSRTERLSSAPGAGFCTVSWVETLRAGPTRLVKASSTCTPVPVSPPAGDSAGSARQGAKFCDEFRLLECPSTWSSRPSRPSAMIAFIAWMVGRKRRLWPIASGTPAARQAATAWTASARVRVSGFSQKTGLPAAATARICARCALCGVASTTACTSGSASMASRLVEKRSPYCAATGAPASGCRATPWTKRRPGWPCPASSSMRPHHPSPTMPAVIMSGRRQPRPLVGAAESGQQVLDLRHRLGAELAARRALRRGADDAAPRQHVFPHGEADAELLLVADQRQMRVEQVVRRIPLPGGGKPHELDQHVGEGIAGH